MKRIAVLLVLAALAGCTQNETLATLEASVAATEALVASLQVAGKIPTNVAVAIETAIAPLPNAYIETAAELSSSDDVATQAIKISSYYASTITALNLLPSDAQVYAAAIQASIQAFLATISTGQKQLSMARSSSAQAPSQAPTFNPKTLKSIAARAATLEIELGAMKLR